MGEYGGSSVVVRMWAFSLLIGLVSLANPALGQDSLCPGDLTNKVSQFDTQNLVCQQYSFPVTNPYVIWALRDNATQIVNMVVSMPLSANKWAGIAFSGDGEMPGSSALVATLDSSGVPVVNQYSLKDRSPAGVVKGGTGLVYYGGAPEAYFDKGTTVYVSFQIDFSRSTPQPKFLLMAYGKLAANGSLNEHDDRTYYDADFVSGTVAGKSEASENDRKSKIHGAIQIMGWGVMLPVGALIARYARSFDPAWFYIHITFQLIGFACIIGGIVTGLGLVKDFPSDKLDAHRGLGFFIFGLAVLQIMALVLRPKVDAKVRRYWNWYHGGVGRLAIFLAVVNVFLGISMAEHTENSFKVAYIAILSIEFLAFIILEVLYWRRWNRQHPRGQERLEQMSEDPPAFHYGGAI